jgi:hypothetical protein
VGCAKVAAGDINSVQQKFLDERTAAMQHELLKAGTSALAEGTSALNRLQQDKAIQEGRQRVAQGAPAIHGPHDEKLPTTRPMQQRQHRSRD